MYSTIEQTFGYLKCYPEHICVQEYNFVSVNSVHLNYWFTCLQFRIPTLRDNLVNDLFHANNRLFTESEFFYCLMARQSKEAQFPHRVFFTQINCFFSINTLNSRSRVMQDVDNGRLLIWYSIVTLWLDVLNVSYRHSVFSLKLWSSSFKINFNKTIHLQFLSGFEIFLAYYQLGRLTHCPTSSNVRMSPLANEPAGEWKWTQSAEVSIEWISNK